MGYNSDFELMKVDPPEKLGTVAKVINEYIDYEYFDEDTGEINGDYMKWYECDKDMQAITARPELKDVLVVIERRGEENGDVERIYAKNGVSISHEPEVVWPDPPEM